MPKTGRNCQRSGREGMGDRERDGERGWGREGDKKEEKNQNKYETVREHTSLVWTQDCDPGCPTQCSALGQNPAVILAMPI